MPLNPAEYLELKEKKTTRMMHLGKGQFAVACQRFNPRTGEELDPELERMTQEQVTFMLEQFKAGVAGCEALLADMTASVRE